MHAHKRERSTLATSCVFTWACLLAPRHDLDLKQEKRNEAFSSPREEIVCFVIVIRNSILRKENVFFFFQEGPHRKESGKRGRKPGRKAADKVDMKVKLGKRKQFWFCN